MEHLVSKAKFKPKALEYFREVEETQQPIVITDRGRAVLKIVPYKEDADALVRDLRGSVIEYRDPMEPVAVEDWEALR